jgi:hypothetical protein
MKIENVSMYSETSMEILFKAHRVFCIVEYIKRGRD